MKVNIGPFPEKDDDDDDGEPGKRVIEIQIHNYDTWNMDDTLALIIAPMLKQLKDSQHGAPFVDPEDVPDYLRSTKEQIEKYEAIGEVDPKHFDRWTWLMDELIWTFETYTTDYESQFFKDVEIDDNIPLTEQIGKLDYDRDGLKAIEERISRGCRLFGKYFRGLWD